MNVNKLTFYAWTIFLSVCIILFYIVFKQHGLEIQNDSTSYIRGALNLKAGLGFTHANVHINHYPVGLSFVYYIIMSLFPVSVFTVALYLNIALLLGIGILFKQIMQTINIAAPIQLAGFAIFFLSPPLLTMGAQLLTELPNTFLITLSTLLLLRSVNKKNVWLYSLSIGIILGAGILIRFAMIGIIAGFAAYQLWVYRNALIKAFVHASLVCLPGILFMLAYSSYVQWRYQKPSVDREWIWHPINKEKLAEFIKTPITWLIQYQYNSIIQTVILGMIALIIIVMLWRTTNKKSNALINRIKENYNIMAFVIISIVYCLFIITSISLFDGATPVDTRILAPISIFFYLGIALLLERSYRMSFNKKRTIILCFVLAITLAWPAKTILSQRYKYPQSFNRPYWQNDAQKIVNDTNSQWIRPNCTIYTNAYQFWQLCNNKKVIKLPFHKNEVRKKINTNYLNQMKAIRNEIAQNNAQIFFFYTMPSFASKTRKSFIDSFFADKTLFNHKPFSKGIIIEARVNTN